MSFPSNDFLHIRTDAFAVHPEHDFELGEDGVIGWALAKYLSERLNERGYTTDFVQEDWGWFIGANKGDFRGQYGIYNGTHGAEEYSLLNVAQSEGRWIWSKFRRVSFAREHAALDADVRAIVEADPRITVLGISDDVFTPPTGT